MAGQPQIPGLLVFDVTNLEVTSEEHPHAPPGMVVLNVIDWGEVFTLRLTFSGEGLFWENMELVPSLRARADFHINETTGTVVYNGSETVDLVPSTGTYTVEHTVPGINAEGIFNLSAEVTIQNEAGAPWYGVLGFVEGYKIQIHSREEIE
jgi:hypothetical protein